MKEDIKQKWVAALESDEYHQATGSLRNTCMNDGLEYEDRYTGYCCLGVLTDLYLKEHEKDWDTQLTMMDSLLDDCLQPASNFALLPKEVAEWSGIAYADPDADPENDPGGTTLSELNDGGQDFKSIARVIKERL